MSKKAERGIFILQIYANVIGACCGYLLDYGEDEEEVVRNALKFIRDVIISGIEQFIEEGNTPEEDEMKFLNKYNHIISKGKNGLKIEELLELHTNEGEYIYDILFVSKGDEGYRDLLVYLLNAIDTGVDDDGWDNSWAWGEGEESQGFRNRIVDLLSREKDINEDDYRELNDILPYKV